MNSTHLLLAYFIFAFAGNAWGQASESFTNIPASSTTYSNRSWTGDDAVTWSATAARTDQTITGKAICTNGAGTVTSPTYTGGMGTLTFDYVRAFTGTNARSFTVWVNGTQIGGITTVSTTSNTVVTYSQAINVSGSVTLEIRTSGAQIKIDDIAWTAYSAGYTVTFDANGGSGSMSNQTASTATALTTNAFTKAGYTFAGWATTAGGAVAYADGDNYPFTANATLYAQWVASGTPTISVGSLTGFGNQCTGSNSTEKTYNVSGSSLTNDIVITAPTGFLVSTTSGSGYSSSVTLAQSGGNVSSTPIYVVFNPSSATAYSANITHTSSGATTQNVAVTGTGIAPVTPAVGIAITTGTNPLCANTSATFTATASNLGGGTATYQWKLNGSNVGSNSTTYTNAALANGDQVRCDISVSGGCVTATTASSTTTTMTVNSIPATPSSPTAAANPSCGATTLNTIAAPGGETYYWQGTTNNGTSTANSTSSTYSVTSSGTYYVRSQSTAGCWSVGSGSLVMTVNTAPNISTQPTNQTIQIASGTNKTFSVTASGTGITYQWQCDNGTAGGSWTNLINTAPYTNVTTATMTVSAATTTITMNGYQYRCIVTGTSPCTTATSNIATLTVNNQAATIAAFKTSCGGYTPGNTVVDLEWIAATTATGYAVFAILGGTAPTGTLNDANTYVANADFSAAATAAPTTLGKCVYNGTGTAVTVTGLTNATAYSFRVFAYNGSTQTGWYTGNAASTKLLNKTIDLPEVSALAASIENASSTITWTNPTNAAGTKCWDEILVVANQGAVTFVPTGDGTAYTESTVYSGANQVVFKATPATTSSLTVTNLTNALNYCFKVFVRKGTEWSDGAEVCVTPSKYCTAASTNTANEFIDNVQFNTINNTSIATTYTDFSAQSTTVEKSETYTLSINNGSYFASDSCIAWIDWNDNGVFENTELVVSSIGSNPYTASVTVPLTANTAAVKMRIRLYDSGSGTQNSTACGTHTYGEVEDYTINVVPKCISAGTITSFLPTSGSQNAIVTINGTGFLGTTAVKFNGVDAASFTIVSNTKITAEVPAGATSGTIRVYDATNCPAVSSTSFTFLNETGTCGGAFTDLILSEIYDSDANNVFNVELYNPTGVAISLNGVYSIGIKSDNTGSYVRTINLTGSVPAGGVYTAALGTSSQTCSYSYDFSSSGSGINALDGIYLIKNGTEVDVAVAPNETGYSLLRVNTASGPTATYNAADWTINSSESCSNLGSFIPSATIDITANPADITTCSFTMSVTATGSGLSYQWKFNDQSTMTDWQNVTMGNLQTANALNANVTVAGATTNTLTLTGDLASLYNYQFYCEVTKSACTKTSSSAQYTYDSKPVYRSVAAANGNWTTVANWEMALTTAGPWSAACAYPIAVNSTEVIIQNGTKIILDIDNSIDKVTVENTGELELSVTSQLTILNANTGADLIVNGTLTDRGSSGNGISFEDNSGTSNDASWTLGANGNIIKTNTSTVAKYRDFYEGGISTIPATANWYYRNNGDGSPITNAVGMYYPNLHFENTIAGNYSWSSSLLSLVGITDYCRVKGNLNIGMAGAGTCTVINNNIHTSPMLLYGNLNINTGSSFTNASYNGVVDASHGNGTGLEIKGNIVNDGTLDLNSASTGVLTFSGSTTQNVSGTGTFDLWDMKVNKPAATLVNQLVNLEVKNTLDFASGGIIKTNANTLFVSNPILAAITGYEAPNRTGSYANDKYVFGYLKRALNEVGTYDYPIGDAVAGEAYNPIELTIAASAAGTVTGKFEVGDPGTINTNGPIPICGGNFVEYTDMTGEGYWHMEGDASAQSFTYDVTLHPNIANVNTKPNEDAAATGHVNNYRALKTNAANAGGTWPLSAATGGDSCVVGEYYAAPGAGYKGFSIFAMGGGNGNTTALPITWLYFKANAIDNSYIQLTWATTSEIDNQGFEVLRSTDGINFEKIGWVAGNGNSTSLNTYSFNDTRVEPNVVYYYQLRQIDNSQKTSYSNIVYAKITNDENSSISLYPNPVRDLINIDLQNMKGIAKLTIVNSLGQIVVENNLQIEDNLLKMQLNTTNLSTGNYVLSVVCNNEIITKRFVVNK